MTTAEQNAQLINNFYSAFARRDAETMASLYADNAVFSDAVFIDLKGAEIGSMWKMLSSRAKDFNLTFSNVKGTEDGGSADWVATYLYGGKHKVENKIHAEFRIINGRIVQHTDSFDFYRWARQALGIPGVLLGWTPFMQKTVRKKARGQLTRYMSKS